MPGYMSKVYSLEELLPGMHLGADIVSENGKVMLAEGTILTYKVIERLRNMGLSRVTIKAEVCAEAISAQKHPFDRPVSATEKNFQEAYSDVVDSIKMTFEAVRKFKKLPGKEMNNMVTEILLPLMHTVGAINYLNQEKPIDQYTYYHSINTAIVAGLLAQWAGYAEAQVEEIVTAGLLHDIGKTQIPLEILNKPGKLTEEEMGIMRQHSVHGYKLIAEARVFSSEVALAALQHHERLDGSGYPAKFTNDKIHPYAKLVAVADIYDAMTSDRVYRGRVTPFAVVETLVAEMYGKLDPDICLIFLNSLRDYFIGSIVELNDGRQAEIVFLGQAGVSQPVVRTAEGEFLTLGLKNNITIAKVVR